MSAKNIILIALVFITYHVDISVENLVSVVSSNNGNGLFTHTINAADEPYFFGGNTNLLKTVIPFVPVISTVDPPGWVSKASGNDTVVWPCTNSASTNGVA